MLLAVLVLHLGEDVRSNPERAPPLSHPAVQVINDEDEDQTLNNATDAHTVTREIIPKTHITGVISISEGSSGCSAPRG